MKTSKIKKVAIVASGWHFPLHFYESMLKQVRPDGWEFEYFCVSHRDPSYAIEEKKNDKFANDQRGKLDQSLYKEIATKRLISELGWNYKEYPNTIGDWGNSNQWLTDNDWKQYDLFLFTHDDNLIVNDRVLADQILDDNFKKWDILANSTGMPPGSIRGSFEMFKPKVIKLLGGQFDLSETTLTREGKFTATNEITELYDWNSTVYPLQRFIEEKKLRVAYLSPCYRVSAYCIEGERGYISKTHGINTQYENAGLTYLHEAGVI